MTSRSPAVAGIFYPADPGVLASAVNGLLRNANAECGGRIKALIAPHAGFVYSGPIAANAYHALGPVADDIRRVVLLGPAHRVPLRGMAFPSVTAFETPLGPVPLDTRAIARALQLPQTAVSDGAHALEHCLEVQLPFLQTVLRDFEVVPFLVGHCAPEEVAAVLQALWGGDETLIVVSSDLSHFLPYAEAQVVDERTTQAIAARSSDLAGEQACGAFPINGLMVAARAWDLRVTTLDVRNSGDTAGDRDRVVGYGAYALA
jgi:hypothetical protein